MFQHLFNRGTSAGFFSPFQKNSVLSPKKLSSNFAQNQCQAINVGFELYIGIESKLSISIIGFDLELGEFCHDFHSISIPINHSGTHFNLPAISTSLK